MVGVYLFEVKGLQSYIFETGRLKEIIGASERLARLTDPSDPDCEDSDKDDSLLGYVLKVCNPKHLTVTRRASGAVYVSSGSDLAALQRFMRLWCVAARIYLPGVEIIQGYAEADTHAEAEKSARAALQSARAQTIVDLPVFQSTMARNARTGRAAMKIGSDPGDEGPVPILLDAQTALKRTMAKGTALKQRCLKDEHQNHYHFPVHLEVAADDVPQRDEPMFPFVGDKRLLGIVHADGTGLGKLLKGLGDALTSQPPDRAAKAYRTVSEILRRVGIEAARKASEVLIRDAKARSPTGVLAARPVILGGEDFSAIVRADLAIEYASAFIREFQDASKKQIDMERDGAFKGIDLGIEQFTACGAVVFVRASQPFARARALAEHMVKDLKRHLADMKLDGKTSALCFYRDHSGIETDLAQVQRSFADADGKLMLLPMLPGYRVSGETHPDLPELAKLISLIESGKLPLGPLRELRGLLSTDIDQAALRYRRMREVLHERTDSIDLDQLFAEVAVGEKAHEQFPIFMRPADSDGPYRCPLLDVQALTAVGVAAAEAEEA